MKTDEIRYELPPELFGREPRELHGGERSASRLLVMKRRTQEIEHTWFPEIGRFLDPGDLIVLNDSKTIKAQLFGWADGKSRVDVRLCVEKDSNVWHCWIQPDRSIKQGSSLDFSNGKLTGTVIKKRDDLNLWSVKFHVKSRQHLLKMLDEIAVPVVPPYAKQRLPLDFYQNVYAKIEGSAEMPTAGRHFTEEIMKNLEEQGIRFVYVTLHTGLSSIPIMEETFEEHSMYEEKYYISKETAEMINLTKEEGHRVVACGTTSVRTLETASDDKGRVTAEEGWTDLYIYPGYKWKLIDALITNFHGPKTTRIALAASFTGNELLMEGYRQAIERGYKFYEYGESTLTL